MKKKFVLTDPVGRYMTAVYDDEEGLLKVTTYLYPQEGVPIEEALEMSGFKILQEETFEKPKVVSLPKKGE